MSEAGPIRVAILTISDRCAAGAMADAAGPALAASVAELLGGTVVATAIVPDEMDVIAARLVQWTRDEPRPDLLLTTGGTGLTPRDVTPEATLGVLDKRHGALLELARLRCGVNTPRAYLSRGEAGTINRTLVINLPGSSRGAVEMFTALADLLPHAIRMVRGVDTDHGRPTSP